MCLSTHPTRQTSLSVTSTSSQRSSQCSRCVGSRREQKRWSSSTALQNMTCRIALNSGSIVGSCVSTQKGTILKVIVVDFLNLLNVKSYRHSLSFLCHTTSASSWFYYKKFVMMHGHMNVKFTRNIINELSSNIT
jgi:hypothetical protein